MLLLAALLTAGAAGSSDSARWSTAPSRHSVRWGELLPEPGLNQNKEPTYHNAMPIGNGHMVANVNFDAANDTLALMITASSFWLEDGEMGKVGLLTLQLPPRGGAPLGPGFSQTFDPQDATVRLSVPAGHTGAPALDIVTYVDAHTDSLVVSIRPPVVGATYKLTLLRPVAQQRQPNSDCSRFEVSADVLTSNGSALYHRNSLPANQTYMARVLATENIPPLPVSEFDDPLNNRATGFKVAAVHAVAPIASSTTFVATLLTAQTDTASQYVAALEKASASYVSALTAESEFPPASHRDFWASKWARHSIEVTAANTTDASASHTTKVISDMYVLQRFIEISQARKPGYPVKFNGMLYGAARPPHQDENAWGGLNWWQNMRLPYYNMLPAGDFDELKTMLTSFARSLPIARQRTKAYFGFSGAWWPEYTQVFYGTEHPDGGVPLYGYRSGANCSARNMSVQGCSCSSCDEEPPLWHSDDQWNGYNRQGSLDLSLMILDHHAYTGEANPELLTIPVEVVEFYSNLWGATKKSEADDTMVFHPTQALETWQCPGWPVDP